MKSILIAVGLLLSGVIHAQQAPKTQEEMEAFLRNIQKKADSLMSFVNARL